MIKYIKIKTYKRIKNILLDSVVDLTSIEEIELNPNFVLYNSVDNLNNVMLSDRMYLELKKYFKTNTITDLFEELNNKYVNKEIKLNVKERILLLTLLDIKLNQEDDFGSTLIKIINYIDLDKFLYFYLLNKKDNYLYFKNKIIKSRSNDKKESYIYIIKVEDELFFNNKPKILRKLINI